MMRREPSQPAPPLDELRFQYQPILSIDGRGGGDWHEALVRWHLPDGTVRGPMEVLPYWLGPNRQASFTMFTLQQAATALLENPDARVSINLSPGQVTHPSAIQALSDLLPEVRSRLIIELTEQRYRNLNALWTSLVTLRERCEFVLLDDVTIDDLHQRVRVSAPVDGIKLDRSLVALLDDPDRGEDVANMVEDACQRYPIVVAEGIEDPAKQGMLKALGVTHVQGFGIGVPQRNIAGAVPQVNVQRGIPARSAASARPAPPQN